jgi:sterol desaturase/sphingolipid hydroxylase (fatty acid hydroxylase superfamily)
VLACLLAFAVAERLAPRAPRPGGIRDDAFRLVRNGALWAVTAGASFLIVVPVTAWASGHASWTRPAWWSGAPGLLLDLLILDFWIYFWHRANHTVPLLWRFHEIHHRDRFLDATSALRFHFGEVLLSAAVRGAVIVALALPLVSVIVFEVLVLFAAIFHHSNLKLAPALERVLSWFVVTPSIHWVHHHRIQADTDSNYATVLSVWDRLFGSRSPTARWPDMPIGTAGREERGLVDLLALPFLSKAERSK